MGNKQTALSGIHPFKDENDPAGLPAPPMIQFPTFPSALEEASSSESHGPQQVTIGPASPRWIEATQGNRFDDLFVMKAPTPPPRRPSEPLRGIRGARQALKGGFSLRSLPKMIGRPDLNKLGTLLRWRKKRKTGEVYPVPPDAEKPSPPSRPEVFLEQDEFFLLRWDPPAYDGGLPIIGYIIQHLELGLPQLDPVEKDETQSWYSSEPGQVTSTEVLLNNLIEGTTYQFRIIAENLLGYSQPGELSEPIVFNPRGILNDYFCPPILIIPLADTYNAIEHERLALSIEITGQPYPIVKWYDRNEMEVGGVGSDPRFIATSCGQKRILTIAGVECTDSGGIRVVGENEKGIVECKASLIVEAPPHIRRVQRLDLMKSEDPQELQTDEQKLLKRRDSRNDEELIFQSGELGRFKFLWSASPYPNICVYHEGDLMDGEETGGDRGRVRNDRVVTEVSDNLITVKINGIRREDRGEWMVRLDNVLGEDSSLVIVTVTDRPSRTGKPDVLQLSDNTVILKWDKPSDDGGCPVQGYIVEYFRSEWGVWLKACTTKNPYTKIRDLIPGSKYKFRVKAENLYGVSEPSEESVELLITDLASTLRSVSGDGEGAAMLMTTVEEEEEDEAVRIEEEEPGTGRPKPAPSPRRRFDRGSSASLMRVSTSTMTEVSGLLKGKSGTTESVEPASIRRPTSSPTLLEPQPSQSIRRSPSPSAKFLSVSFQPQVIVLPDDDEGLMGDDVLLPPALAPRRLSPEVMRRSPSPMNINLHQTIDRSPSPLPPKPLSRTVVQQLNLDEPMPLMTVEETRKSPSRSPLLEEMLGPAPVPPRRHVMQHQQQQQQQQQQQPPPAPPSPRPRPQPPQLPIQIQPITDTPKKLYSRAEIIKSAATNELDYYYLGLSESSGAEAGPEEHHEEEPEEDPELLKVKEALKNDTLFDDLEDEEEDEEYEYDFDKLREEYEEDKKKGMVSRQDSGVSGKSVEKSESIEVEEEPASYSEDLEEDERGRAASVQSERVTMRSTYGSFREPFERAQSEITGPRPRGVDDDFMERGRGQRPSGGQPLPPTGSKTFLTDRFTDYIAMKASSRNKAVGSSLRSLSNSRYSSTENVEGKRGSISRDSGRSSMNQPESAGAGGGVVGGGAASSGEEKLRPEEQEGEDINTVINRVSLLERPFTFREFRAEEEMKGLKGLEGSKPSLGSKRSVSSLPYDLVHPVQTGDSSRKVLGAGCDYRDPSEEGEGRDPEELEKEAEEERAKRRKAPPIPVVPNRFISNPDIFLMMSGDGGRRGREVLEHSKSETNFDTWIPDSVLKMRAGSFMNRGGCEGEDTTEEDYSYGADEFPNEPGGSGSAEIGFERDCPVDRRETEGQREIRRTVSFGVDTDEDFSYEEEYEKIEDDGTGGEEHHEEGAVGEAARLEEILEEGGNEYYDEEGEHLEGAEDEEHFEGEEGEEHFEGEEGEEHFEGEEEGHSEEILEEVGHRQLDDEEFDEEIERMKLEMIQLEVELGLVERDDFGEIPKENVWIEEHILEEYSEEDGNEEEKERAGEDIGDELEEDHGEFVEKDEEQPVEENVEPEVVEEQVLEEPKPEVMTESHTLDQPTEQSEEPVQESKEEVPEEVPEEKIASKDILVESEEPEPVLEESLKIVPQEDAAPQEKAATENMESNIIAEEKIAEVEMEEKEIVDESVTVQKEPEISKYELEKVVSNPVEEVTESMRPVEESVPTEEFTEDLEAKESIIVEGEIQAEKLEETFDNSAPDEKQETQPAEPAPEGVDVDVVEQAPDIPDKESPDSPEEGNIQDSELEYSDLAITHSFTIGMLHGPAGNNEPESPSKLISDVEAHKVADDDVVEGQHATTEAFVAVKKPESILPEKLKDLSEIAEETTAEPEQINKVELPIEEKKEKLTTETLPDSTEPISISSDLREPCDAFVAQEPACDFSEPEQDKPEKSVVAPEVSDEGEDIIKKTVEEIPTLAELCKTADKIPPLEDVKTIETLGEVPTEGLEEEPPNQIKFDEGVKVEVVFDKNSRPRTIEASVQLEDTLIVEDVVIGKMGLEMNLGKISAMSARLHPEGSDKPRISPSPASAPHSHSPIEDEIDKELLTIYMNLPSSEFPHHHYHPHHHSEPRKTISIDRLVSLTPVEEETPAESRSIVPPPIPQRRPPPLPPSGIASTSSPPSYRPNMSIYDKIMMKPSSMSSSSSLSSSRISISSRSSTSTIATPRPTSPFHLEDGFSGHPLDISEIRHTILQSSPREFLETFSLSSQSSSPRGTPPPSSSRPSTPIDALQLSRTEQDYPDEISPFMNYLFHGAFYLMLSPMLLFVDSLYLALVCLVVVACVHFFIIKF